MLSHGDGGESCTWEEARAGLAGDLDLAQCGLTPASVILRLQGARGYLCEPALKVSRLRQLTLV